MVTIRSKPVCDDFDDRFGGVLYGLYDISEFKDAITVTKYIDGFPCLLQEKRGLGNQGFENR